MPLQPRQPNAAMGPGFAADDSIGSQALRAKNAQPAQTQPAQQPQGPLQSQQQYQQFKPRPPQEQLPAPQQQPAQQPQQPKPPGQERMRAYGSAHSSAEGLNAGASTGMARAGVTPAQLQQFKPPQPAQQPPQLLQQPNKLVSTSTTPFKPPHQETPTQQQFKPPRQQQEFKLPPQQKPILGLGAVAATMSLPKPSSHCTSQHVASSTELRGLCPITHPSLTKPIHVLTETHPPFLPQPERRLAEPPPPPQAPRPQPSGPLVLNREFVEDID